MCSRIRLLPSSPKYNFDLSNASANSFHPAGDVGDHFSVDCGLKPGESYIISMGVHLLRWLNVPFDEFCQPRLILFDNFV